MMKTIYLVEDDDGIREMLQYVLNPSYTVEAFENLRLFNNRLQQSIPDLIIMDIMLPDGNGDEAGMALQKNESTQHIPVLFMSANMKFEFSNDLAKHDFISKPFDIKLLKDKVKNLVKA